MWGELDRISARVLDRHLDAVDTTQPSALLIDATGLSFCDSAGVRTIVRAHNRSVAHGTNMRLVGLKHSVQRVFRLTGLNADSATD